MDSLALVGRLVISLAFVLGLMWVIARRVRKGPGRMRNGQLMDVLARQQLSRTASVALVRVMDKALIVGITDGQVNVLGETPLDAVEARVVESAPSPRPRLRPVPAVTQPARPMHRSAERPVPGRTRAVPQQPQEPARKNALAGSALSMGTWRQAVDSIRDLTVRTR